MRARPCAFLLLLCVLASSSAFADEKQTFRVEGRVVSAGVGELLLEQTIDSARATDFLQMGYRRVASRSDAGHRTILGDKIYHLYWVDIELAQTILPSSLVGRDVVIDLQPEERGDPRVVFIKTKP